MTTILIADHAPRAYTWDEGKAIADLVASRLDAGDDHVIVDASDLSPMSTSFTNGSCGTLAARYGLATLRIRVKVVSVRVSDMRAIRASIDPAIRNTTALAA